MDDVINDLGSSSLSLHSGHLEYQLNPYADNMMTVIILGITVRHKVSGGKGERIPPEVFPSKKDSREV